MCLVLVGCAVAEFGPRVPSAPALRARELTERQVRLRDAFGLADADFARPSPLVKRGNGLRADSMRTLRARAAETPEWSLAESAHYAFLFAGNDEPFLRRLVEETESARALVREYFSHPELDPVPVHTAPHVVRCAKDAELYHSYGGPPGGHGYWSPLAGELVVYRERADGDATTWHALRGLVFLAYASELWGTCELPAWFALGHAEYFAGFVERGEALLASPPPERIELVSSPNAAAWSQWMALDARAALVPVPELLSKDRPDVACRVEWQASAWALVWHLRALEREAPEASPSRVLARWVAEWPLDGDAQRATRIAFAGIDLEALDRAVVERIRALGAPPRPGSRR
ncbi:MAG: hypothetical protein IPJ77_13525 [Planctomycetes bacterium]|nr:hypothetical protein [Planctomycetota bacterium]